MLFRPALDLVVSALEEMQTQERLPRASRGALQELLTRAASAEVVTSYPPPTARDSDEISRANETGKSASAAAKDKAARLRVIGERVAVCEHCPHLVKSRTQTVFGVGNPDADLMFIGEAPGADEDAQGEPFVGRAGQLLTKIIQAMGVQRDDVYIANILKCRPDMPGGVSGNRPPTPQEMQTCLPYLSEQIEIVQPKVLVALGATAVEGLLGFRGTMRELRGRWHSYQETPLMITYHPSYLLRNQAPSEKRKVWEDMLQVMERLEYPISAKQRKYFL